MSGPIHSIALGKFMEWLRYAEPGEQIEYCIGNNVFQVVNDPGLRASYSLYPLFSEIRTHQRAGMVMLFQKKLDSGLISYIAIRTREYTHETVRRIANG